MLHAKKIVVLGVATHFNILRNMADFAQHGWFCATWLMQQASYVYRYVAKMGNIFEKSDK